MKRYFNFSEDKFRGLKLAQQHKKCFELIRVFVVEKDNDEKKRLKSEYQKLCRWLELDSIDLESAKELSDRYHLHLRHADLSIKEHDFLPIVIQNDKETDAPFLPISIYLDNLRSVHNIGSIIRTCEAFRLGMVLFSHKMGNIQPSSLEKSAMGAQKWVEYSQAPEISKLVRPLISLETVLDAEDYYDVTYPEKFTIAVGNEEYGLSDEILKETDIFIKIPLYGRKNSLNVANAFAIVASEIVKQRKYQKKRCGIENDKSQRSQSP